MKNTKTGNYVNYETKTITIVIIIIIIIIAKYDLLKYTRCI
jgi:hypothetical protein